MLASFSKKKKKVGGGESLSFISQKRKKISTGRNTPGVDMLIGIFPTKVKQNLNTV